MDFDSIVGPLQNMSLSSQEHEGIRQQIIASADITSIFAPLQAVRLSAKEHQEIRHQILQAALPTTAPQSAHHPSHLFAYEKAMIFDAIQAFVQQHSSRLQEAPIVTKNILFVAHHGNLFRHLQPFVLE